MYPHLNPSDWDGQGTSKLHAGVLIAIFLGITAFALYQIFA